MRNLSDETLDGLAYGFRLYCNPRIRERTRLFNLKISAFRKHLKGKSKQEMIEELITNNPGYIRALLEKSTDGMILERYVYTFIHKWSVPSE